MMNAVIVTCVYPPEPVVSAETSAHIAEALAQLDHTTTVVTSFPSRPSGKLHLGYSRGFVRRDESSSGIKTLRCFSILSSESSMVSRLMENLSFGLSSSWQILTMSRPDVIYANTWPIVAATILFLVAKLRRIPLVISIQDIYPDALISQNRISQDGLLARTIRWVDRTITRNSSHVIVISKNFAQIYLEQRQIPLENLSQIPNWVDGDKIDISISGQEYRESRNVGNNEFLIVYGGNIGVAAGVEKIIEAMHLFGDEVDVRLLIAGSGSQLSVCQNLVGTIRKNRVLIHSPWLSQETSQILRAANLLILPTQGKQSLASVPSKLLSYMLAGRPILVTALPDSDLADLVIRSRCGWVIEPEQPVLLAAKIRDIMKLDSAKLRQLGDNGRIYALQHFAKDACVSKVVEILEEASR